MTPEEIKRKIKDTYFKMFEDLLPDEDFGKDWRDLAMDDLDTVEFIMRLEADLNVAIPDEFLEGFETPENLLSFITKITEQ